MPTSLMFTEHVRPLNPTAHAHENELSPSVHVPPLRHGLSAQSSSLISQPRPRNPDGQTHSKEEEVKFFLQMPPLRHGVLGKEQLNGAIACVETSSKKTRTTLAITKRSCPMKNNFHQNYKKSVPCSVPSVTSQQVVAMKILVSASSASSIRCI
jgi:hypothetical protein